MFVMLSETSLDGRLSEQVCCLCGHCLFSLCIYALYLCLRYFAKALEGLFFDKKKNDG